LQTRDGEEFLFYADEDIGKKVRSRAGIAMGKVFYPVLNERK
jgi:hypothetical protein